MIENRLAKCDKCHRLFFNAYYPVGESIAACTMGPAYEAEGKCQCNSGYTYISFMKKEPERKIPTLWSTQ